MKMTVSRAGAVRGGRRLAGGPARRPGVMVVLAAAAVVCAGSLAGAGLAPAAASVRAAAARVHWGRAEPVPGLGALNKGYDASVSAISCWGAGGCVVGGFYTGRHGHAQAFVARERKGRWGSAVEVPGTAALNKGGNARVGLVSCAPTSVCVAVGTYTDQAGNTQWFTVTTKDGRWRTAAQVPDPALSNAAIGTVWCAPGGLCAAGGTFTDPSTGPEAWVMTETHGRWQPALEVPGIAALNTGGAGVSVDAVSCASAGNCAAGGQYAIANPGSESSLGPFVVTETDGTWGTAQEVPGIQTMTPGIWAETTSMACPSAGNCAAAGYYNNGSDADSCFTPTPGCASVFEVNERHGSWGQVNARTYNFSYIVSLTCPAAGDCVAAGIAADESSAYPGYVDFGELVSETNGDWARAGVLVLTSTSSVNSVSCAKPGYCAAGGTTAGCQACNDEGQTAFVISEWHGTWGKAVTPAGLPRYHPNEPGGATVSAVACPPKVALCIAGGSESPANSNRAQAFIVSQAR